MEMMSDPVTLEPKTVRCRRCDADVVEAKAERCWFCNAVLCWRCWDRIGHCGHPAAVAAEKHAREALPYVMAVKAEREAAKRAKDGKPPRVERKSPL